MTDKLQEIVVAYGSQTGNSEYIAKHIHTEALQRGYKSRVTTLDDSLKNVNWNDSFALVVVVSSTGDGDPPDNALTFFKKRNITKLPPKKYGILGLGDTNYDNFNNTAKRLDKMFKELGNYIEHYNLGSEPIIEKGLADDATGLEAVVEDWQAKLWEIMPHHVERDLKLEEDYLTKNSSILEGINGIKLQQVNGIQGIDLKEIENVTELTNLAKLLNTTLEMEILDGEGRENNSIFEIL
jgi:methionine synthase reductase